MVPSETSLKNLDLTLLAQRLGRLCKQLDVEVTAAESCTGGGIASAITGVAGSSAYFTTGYVTYANAAKTRLLGVPEATLAEYGAVSEAVVNAMVAGACRESGAGLAVAVSGVAGPDGGSAEKPVGTVWLAWGDAAAQEAECFHFPGDRPSVREQAVRQALVGLVARLNEREKTSKTNQS
ncbi:CinA family protein [Halomonas sp. ISL-60]|uniref:CinA family protein n=1 Tax=unclassified Halomonas TaxID=2609666 RepID=UPI001BE91874|nr:CinA family protein [Halomonas sp. ISL-60]MBT2786692.1 CinA family protein [Halomonas sp. ISL-106]MBT2798656.1 CinA family protein [Halomonas sp. ISL-104]MBT2800599.1 CinA family protein [Halomonas sp. ISL-56]